MNTQNQPASATIRCMDCGRGNEATDQVCEFCGGTLRSDQTTFSNPLDGNGAGRQQGLPQFQSLAGSEAPMSLSVSGPAARSVQRQDPTQDQIEDKRVANADLRGRVIAAEPVIHEHPDFDWCKFATRLLWFLLLVVSPFMLLRTVFAHLGALPAIFAIFGFLFLLRFFSPTNIFSLIQLNLLLNPLRRHEAEQVPVRYFRVRDLDEREWIVRMKGRLDGGNIAPDDLISAWGNWRSGALNLLRAYNHRTQSYVFVRTPHSWMMLVATVGLIIFLCIYFYKPFHTMWQLMHRIGNP